MTRSLIGIALLTLRLSTSSATECLELKTLKLANAEITVAELVAAGEFTPPATADHHAATLARFAKLPTFCRVAGAAHPTADSDIRFEVWLPASDWNGKFVGVGNGAWAGSIPHTSLIDPLQKRYATAATDTGHQGDSLDARFATNHPEKLIDFGYRAVHEMTVAAKAVINAYYGKKPARALFASCSTGGRQALMEAYRYPEDYDAISSMAPANPMVALMVSSLWTGSATSRDAASRLSPAQFELVHQAAIAACDARDGVKDGIIAAPMRCSFDPGTLPLTPAQIAAIRAMYKGPHNPRTGVPILPGFERGSESLLPIQASGDGPFPAVSSYFRDLVFNDPQWDFRAFDYDKDVARAQKAHGEIVDVPPRGLDKYLASGRKLLVSHGWADPLVPPRSSIQFFQALPHAATNARLFMIPGMGHCGGGDGPHVFDPIATLDEWVETSRAPERLVVSNPANAPMRTRPVCSFPQEAIYSGAGSTDDEKNFRCEASPAQ
jgi:feruloyl esterase